MAAVDSLTNETNSSSAWQQSAGSYIWHAIKPLLCNISLCGKIVFLTWKFFSTSPTDMFWITIICLCQFWPSCLQSCCYPSVTCLGATACARIPGDWCVLTHLPSQYFEADNLIPKRWVYFSWTMVSDPVLQGLWGLRGLWGLWGLRGLLLPGAAAIRSNTSECCLLLRLCEFLILFTRLPCHKLWKVYYHRICIRSMKQVFFDIYILDHANDYGNNATTSWHDDVLVPLCLLGRTLRIREIRIAPKNRLGQSMLFTGAEVPGVT